MGTWGPALFSDDTAGDIRDEYRDYIGNGLSPEKAKAALMQSWAASLQDPDIAPVFWLSLAATQWRLGRLDDETKSRALEVIRDGSDLRRWDEDPALRKKRGVVLEKLEEQLRTPQPPARKVPRPVLSTCDWPVGEVVSYQRPTGVLVLFRVLEHYTDRGGTYPTVEFLDWAARTVPDASSLGKLEPVTHRGCSQFMICGITARQLNGPHFRRLGAHGTPSVLSRLILGPNRKVAGGVTVWLWRFIERHLNEYFPQLSP